MANNDDDVDGQPAPGREIVYVMCRPNKTL